MSEARYREFWILTNPLQEQFGMVRFDAPPFHSSQWTHVIEKQAANDLAEALEKIRDHTPIDTHGYPCEFGRHHALTALAKIGVSDAGEGAESTDEREEK